MCNLNTHELVELPKPCGNSITTKYFALMYIPFASKSKLLPLIHIHCEENDLVLRTSFWIYDIRNDGKSGSHSWRLVPEQFPHSYPWLMHVVENVDGTVYWWMKPEHYGQERKKEKIISIDIMKEDFLIIDEPLECSYPSGNYFSLVGFKGQLSLTCTGWYDFHY